MIYLKKKKVLELKHLHSDTKLASKCIDKKKLEVIENGMVNFFYKKSIKYILNNKEIYFK